MLRLPISRMEELFSRIDAERALYLPREESGLVSFGRWAPGIQARLDHLLPARPVKDFFFPQTENLVLFHTQGKEIRIEENRDLAAPFALFGVRACDAESLRLLDRVFLSDPVDTFYEERRRQGLLITTACAAPEETCFCGAYGIDAAAPGGDVATWLTEEGLYWESRTEKGHALTDKVKHLFDQGSETDGEAAPTAQARQAMPAVQAQQAAIRAIMDKLPLRDLDLQGYGGEALMEKFDDPRWERLSEACLGCGTCTFVCPTCHCYDIRDFDTGHGIQRFRCWDSCLYSDFTLMAGGNPRHSRLERFRQRYMHKLVYFPANQDGLYACVGCGRCIAKCPISMNITKVVRALGVPQNAE